MKNLLVTISILLVFLSSCKYEVPPKMVIGSWYVEKITENKHDFTSKHVNKYNRYLTFFEDGTFKVGVLDSSQNKNWLLYSEKNELMLLNGSPVENVTSWKIKASDESIELKDKRGHYKMILRRIDSLPEISLKNKEELIGKWSFDKVTINGYDNTEEYAFPDRWILLSDDGRFYNGGNKQNQNSGFWQLNESLTAIDFFDKKDQTEAFISFHIEDELIWYEKQASDYDKASVRIYFKKE